MTRRQRVTKQQLIHAAEEVNRVFAPTDPIDPTGMEVGDLKQVLLVAGSKIVIEDGPVKEDDGYDHFSEASWKTLQILGAIEFDTPEEPPEAAPVPPTPEPEPEETEPEPEPEPEPAPYGEGLILADHVKAEKRLEPLKHMVKLHPEFTILRKELDTFKGMQGPRNLKKKMFACLGLDNTGEPLEATPATEPAPEPKPVPETAPAPPKSNAKPASRAKPVERTKDRYKAIKQAIRKSAKKGFTKSEILALSDEIYVEMGGNSNPNVGTGYLTYLLKGVSDEEMPRLTLQDGVYKERK